MSLIPKGYHIFEIGISRVKSPFRGYPYITLQSNIDDRPVYKILKDDGTDEFRQLCDDYRPGIRME